MTGHMQAAVITKPDAAWELQTRPIPEPAPGQVLVRVRACGICGTDLWMAQDKLSYRPFPLVLGHEGVGEVVAVGAGVTTREVGDRVGMPMVQKGCGRCDFCREEHPKSFVTAANCANPILTGVTVDGAHADYAVVDAAGTVRLPDAISYEDAAPTLCAGFTVWAALRRADLTPNARVTVVGIGGLGHLAIQYAKAAGYHVTAITHSPDKQAAALELGADQVVGDGAALRDAGGADLIMHTASHHGVVNDAMTGLKPWGKVVMMGIAFDDMYVPALSLVSNSHQIIGSAHNGYDYLEEALGYVARGQVKPRIEIFTKENVAEAYDRVVAGDVRFKAVVTY